MGRKAGTEVSVNSCLLALIATKSVSIALSWLLLPPEVGVNRHGLQFIIVLIPCMLTSSLSLDEHVCTRDWYSPRHPSATGS